MPVIGAADTLAIDAVLAQARRIATDGDLTGARRRLDALAQALEAHGPGAPRLAEVLFWRATYARTAADAERDYRRLVVEHPLSPRAEDALLRLAQLELARGDQALAIRHLERLVLEHPESANRARARYWTGRAWLDAGDATKACTALGDALGWAAATDTALRGQVRASAQRCPRGWDAGTTQVAVVPAVSAAQPPVTAPVTTPVSAPVALPVTPPVSMPSTPPVSTPVTKPTSAPAPAPSTVSGRTDSAPAPMLTYAQAKARADSILRAGTVAKPATTAARPAITSSAPVTSPPASTPAADSAVRARLAADSAWRAARARADAAARGGPPPNTTIPPTPRETVTTSAPPASPPRTTPVTSIPASTPPPLSTPTTSPAKPPAASRRTTYAVQLAAYDTRPQAAALVARLTSRGLAARVSGDVAPFRVRVGRFDTRAAAARELAALKAKGMAGFIVDEPSEAP